MAMDRFSLLLLQPGEIYLEDYAVDIYQDPDGRPLPSLSEAHERREREREEAKQAAATGHNGRRPSNDRRRGSGSKKDVKPAYPKKISGRVKICANSLVIVPDHNSNIVDSCPVIKISYTESTKLEEYEPKTFQSKLAAVRNALRVRVKSYTELTNRRGAIAPYAFREVDTTFVLVLRYVKIEHPLPLIQQLQRASSLPMCERNSMTGAIVMSRQSRTPFDLNHLESPIQERIALQTTGNRIRPLVVNPGRIVATDMALYFQPYNNAEAAEGRGCWPVVKIRLEDIKRVYPRRYLLRPIGVELEFLNYRGFVEYIYLTFDSAGDREKLVGILRDSSVEIEEIKLEEKMADWREGRMSNFEYLLYVNNAADRSFNDLTQYPVFPWVIKDYTSDELDLNDEDVYRDLSKPMGALNEERLRSLQERMEDLPEDKKFLYGSHYSTPGFVLYFLVRQMPKHMLCLQNGRFDHPDRMFNSVAQTWRNVTNNLSDFKELIPEFYMPEKKGEFLQNFLEIDFGVRNSGVPVGDVDLPPWADESAPKFVRTLRKALESEFVSRNLHHWIDLIFGCKQKGQEAVEANNIFYPLCYEGNVDLEAITVPEEKHAMEVQISEFGQVPKQLFTQPHPSKYS